MRAILCHSYEEQQQTTPGFVWPCAPPRGNGRLVAKLKDTGKLPLDIPILTWKADPTHHIKIIAKHFFNLLKKGKSASTIMKADCLCLKISWGYMLKQNQNKQMSEMMRAAKSPLDHLFDEHQFCKQREAATQYYQCKTKDAKLYAQLFALFQDFMTKSTFARVAIHMTPSCKTCPPSTRPTAPPQACKIESALLLGYKCGVSSAVDDFLIAQDNSCNKRKSFKQQKDAKQMRIKRIYDKMKDKCTKTKKDLEDGKGYGDDKGYNLDGNMTSTCKCSSSPGKKNHETAKSKEYIWHQKFIGATASKTRESIDKLTEQYLSVGGIDATDLLANIVCAAPVTIMDEAIVLHQKFEDYAKNEANKTAENDEIGVDTTLKKLPGLASSVLINNESAGTSTSSFL
eukprot:2264249-Ditylum_brightwellii.AAC.2